VRSTGTSCVPKLNMVASVTRIIFSLNDRSAEFDFDRLGWDGSDGRAAGD
jgi:hypothetical protein